MNFKEYYSKPLKESPDMVFVNNKELLWSAPQARTFGWVQILPGVQPFFICAKRGKISHFDIVEELAEKLEGFVWAHEDALGTPQAQPLLVKYLTRRDIESFIIPDVENVAREILSSRKLIQTLVDEDLLKQFNRLAFAGQKFGAATNVKKEMNYAVRSKILKNAGRIWLKNRVMSFWVTEQNLTPETIDTVFNYFNVPAGERDKYLIDAINLQDLKKEETPDKVLPSYREYKTRKSAPQKASKEDQKRAAEFMAKQHGVAGAQKAKFKVGELPFKHIPPEVRAASMTSESLI